MLNHMEPQPQPPNAGGGAPRPRRARLWLLVGLVAVVALAGAGWWAWHDREARLNATRASAVQEIQDAYSTRDQLQARVEYADRVLARFPEADHLTQEPSPSAPSLSMSPSAEVPSPAGPSASTASPFSPPPAQLGPLTSPSPGDELAQGLTSLATVRESAQAVLVTAESSPAFAPDAISTVWASDSRTASSYRSDAREARGQLDNAQQDIQSALSVLGDAVGEDLSGTASPSPAVSSEAGTGASSG